MESNEKKKSGVAALRDLFYEIKRKQKPSPELEDAVKQKKPLTEKNESDKDRRKIATPKLHEDLDL